MLLLIADQISTKYKDRDTSYEQVADLIHEIVIGKTGNYIAYFPSYKFLHEVHTIYSEKHSEVITVRQEQKMGEKMRDDFLKLFDDSSETMLAFCVLGGVFAEGIDLEGDKLIGTVIVGVGLPQINNELDQVRNHYAASGNGYDFAYRLPGMNKVLQAAGRVIRSDKDRGVVLLIDSRFSAKQYTSLYPPHWRHYKIVRNTDDMSHELEKFWRE
jgi:Rad3-related DNA helicase